ncbi:MAG: hypothetical protein ABSA91_04215 [Acidimicrobiales bacterium]
MAETSEGPPAPSVLPEPLPPDPPNGELPEPPLPGFPDDGVVVTGVEAPLANWLEGHATRLTPAPATPAAAITRMAAADRSPLAWREGPCGESPGPL